MTIILSMQEGCIMLFAYYSVFLFCQNEKGLLNFVSERIIIFKAFLQNLQYSVELLKK